MVGWVDRTFPFRRGGAAPVTALGRTGQVAAATCLAPSLTPRKAGRALLRFFLFRSLFLCFGLAVPRAPHARARWWGLVGSGRAGAVCIRAPLHLECTESSGTPGLLF